MVQLLSSQAEVQIDIAGDTHYWSDNKLARSLFKQHYGWKSKKDCNSCCGKEKNGVSAELLARNLKKIFTSKLLQLGVIALARMFNCIFADPSIDTSTIAAASIHAASASYRYSSSAHGLGFHAFKFLFIAGKCVGEAA
ncbi:hypothetical protein Patl1_27124 [Pistacia atlantica]|uniref:Uncharacterized protein n=1 Tax=Pistacia atlantica TaxID=434234 RepID=A0ACC1B0N8_9ROSI|nr:hypothetical protein Patl1_27124 [Pistacia atlantica]